MRAVVPNAGSDGRRVTFALGLTGGLTRLSPEGRREGVSSTAVLPGLVGKVFVGVLVTLAARLNREVRRWSVRGGDRRPDAVEGR